MQIVYEQITNNKLANVENNISIIGQNGILVQTEANPNVSDKSRAYLSTAQDLLSKMELYMSKLFSSPSLATLDANAEQLFFNALKAQQLMNDFLFF